MYSDNIPSEEYIRGLLDLPKGTRVESIISFGYPDEDKSPVPKEQLYYHKIISMD
jgi:nitroreductase